MGGIGKSTIAKAIFHRIAWQFESVCFLTDVKNEAKKGLQHLQETFLFKIFGERNLYMDTFMVSKLSRKKILVVLDDVDDSEHLEVLADQNYFGLGSRIIITSRDRQMLYNIGGDKLELYKVEGLNGREALQLFNEKAFKQSFSPEDYMELPRKYVSYCGGNPLALQVLGGSLFCKSMPQYPSKSLPSKFNPDHLVELDMSYSNLHHLWKDTKDLGNLRQISLIGCKQLIEVPDLSGAPNLRFMYLYGCSNLTKFPKISRSVKQLDLGSTAVEEIPSLRHLNSLEALFLDGCSNINKFPQISGAITYLNLGSTEIQEVPDSAIKSLNKLVNLRFSQSTRLKNLPTSMIHLTSLKTLLLAGCSNITKFPQISGAITELYLSRTAIDEVPNSAIESLYNLVHLDLRYNTRLKNLPSMSRLTSL
ncbi:hypothetical protein Ddye_019202 [Dipteronia dyeriana]|uniref:NB-ARC domain-containing protein n=1 Tax=Dipteronia dyeriana TaxID=168575 RepID=A0AAD9TXW7_9ROSI|nr:hypothetical protein Ddye_019202 [Dipteronia dyeriana]